MKKILAFLFFTLIFLFSGRGVHAQVTWPAVNCQDGFQDVAGSNSIRYKVAEGIIPNTSYNLRWHIVKINLDDDAIDLMVTPESINLAGQEIQTLGTTTSQFAQAFGAMVAINGDLHDRATFDPLGLAAAEGEIYSFQSAEPSICINENNEVNFFCNQGAVDWDAISGSHTLVAGGDVPDILYTCANAEYCSERRPRTAIGYIPGQNTLVIMITEGDVIPTMPGISILELANMINQCNVRQAIALDGGGSSTLYMNGDVVYPGGIERVVANHFGICLGSCANIDVVPVPNPPLPEGDATPRPYVSCNDVRNNEFHSLRPYQASPCNPNYEDLAYFCGNNLIIADEIGVTKNFGGEPYCQDPTYTVSGDEIIPHIPGASGYICRYCDASGECVQNDGPCIDEAGMCNTRDDCNGCDPIYELVDGHGVQVGERCSFTFTQTRDIAVDVSGAEFPIMGYTEPSANLNENDPEVTNSTNPLTTTGESVETLSHSAKMNEYVSWYLNGVNNRAEYQQLDVERNCIGETTSREGTCRDTIANPLFFELNNCSTNVPGWEFDGKANCGAFRECCVADFDILGIPVDREVDMLDRDKLINYSGPLKKLLPIRIQHKERIEEIAQARSTRHNQTAACTYGLSIPGPGGSEYNIGGIPGACYLDGLLSSLLDVGPVPLRQYRRLTEWLNNLPPLEDSQQYEDQRWINFLLDYREWRGQACLGIQLPDIGLIWPGPIDDAIENLFRSFFVGHTIFMCIDTPTSANFWGTLFDEIPLSSTEDRLGRVQIRNILFQLPTSPNFNIIRTSVTNTQPANLFVPHMEETVELAATLQETFVPFGLDVDTLETSDTFMPPNDYCEMVDVRSNPGDELFAGELSATIEYTAEVTCEFLTCGNGNLCENLMDGECRALSDIQYCDTNYGQYDCDAGEYCVDVDSCDTASHVDSTFCLDDYVCYQTQGEIIESCAGLYQPVADICAPGVTGATCYFSNCNIHTATDEPNNSQSCSEPVYVQVGLETQTPLVNEAWSKMVAGPASVFKRIFPRVTDGAPVEQIWDIPAATDVSYSSDDPNITIRAGNPVTARPGSNAQLYFPHIGGIYEYFLNGIQSLLRPKGYGRGIIIGGDSTPVPADTSVCSIGIGDCSPTSLRSVWGDDAEDASRICQLESGASATVVNDGCTFAGGSYDYSVGLFQINLAPVPDGEGGVANTSFAASNCPEAFDLDASEPYGICVVANQTQLDACVALLQDPLTNSTYAHNHKFEYQYWCAWETNALQCGLVPYCPYSDPNQ